MAKRFQDLNDREILALAIALEEEDSRVYADFADGLRDTYPDTAKMFEAMHAEESEHRASLIEQFQRTFGNHIPLIRRQDVRGFLTRKPVWLTRPLGISTVRKQAEEMELETRNFYDRAIQRVSDASTRKLLGDLAEAERRHYQQAGNLEKQLQAKGVPETEDRAKKKLFLLQVVQPGLAGLMDGSVSTLAPVFAAALATHSANDAFRVGLAASVGAGISMGFAESLSDDGSLTGRGLPWVRGLASGVMTALGGIGHTLPFLISDFRLALIIAGVVVAVELAVISYIRNRFMETPFGSAIFQVVAGGVLVFLTGVLIGSS